MVYGFETTAEEIAKDYDLRGKNVIVTGGYTGIPILDYDDEADDHGMITCRCR